MSGVSFFACGECFISELLTQGLLALHRNTRLLQRPWESFQSRGQERLEEASADWRVFTLPLQAHITNTSPCHLTYN